MAPATCGTSVLTPTSWVVNDGVNSLDEPEDCDNLDALTLTTDAKGNITDCHFSVDDGMLTGAIFSAGLTRRRLGVFQFTLRHDRAPVNNRRAGYQPALQGRIEAERIGLPLGVPHDIDILIPDLGRIRSGIERLDHRLGRASGGRRF